jgi:hypothetical protein
MRHDVICGCAASAQSGARLSLPSVEN